MTGKVHTMWGEFGDYKHPNALSYQCALMLAFDARCSIGDQLHPTGAIDKSTYALIGRALKDVEAAEPWVKGAEPIAEIALFSASSLLAPGRGDNEARKSSPDHGAARVLVESHLLFDVVDRYSDFAKYKVLILLDVIRLDRDFAERIEAYLRGGGRVLASGKSGFAQDDDRSPFRPG